MVKVDLITGFLGAGKTTFIQKYIKYLKEKGEKIHIIENEFAEKGVDTFFLQKQEDDCCKISDLSGMCMCCIGKKEFIRLLIESAQSGCSRILVEPSGIYDVDEFFDVLSDERVCSLCEIGSIITIVDPMLKEELTEEAKYLMFAQLVASGTIVYSKTQLIEEKQLKDAMEFVEQLSKEKGCENGLPGEVYTKSWDLLTDDDFEEMENLGYFRLVHDREMFEHSTIFQSEEIKIVTCKDKDEIRNKIKSLFETEEYGRIYRVKGYIKTTTGQFYEVNATGKLLAIETADVSNEGVVIIGQQLRRKALYHIA